MWSMFAFGLLTGIVIGAGGFFIWCWIILYRSAKDEARRQLKMKINEGTRNIFKPVSKK